MKDSRHRLERIYASHRTLALFYHTTTGNLWKPSHAKLLVSDMLDRRTKPKDNFTHCLAALRWLFKAQDVTKVGGVSAEYNFSWGWSLPYPEVSGYIIPTMLDIVDCFGDVESESRALKIADWLVSIQNKDGSFNSALYYDAKVHGRLSFSQKASVNGQPTAFETGQILWGLCAIYEHTGDRRYLNSAVKAGDWLVEKQLSDGSWANEVQGMPRTFSALTARHLALLYLLAGNINYRKASIKNCDWCLTKQNKVGWFDECSHAPGFLPWTHGIGYAMQGLLETGIFLKIDKYIDGAVKTAESLLRLYSLKGFKSIYRQERGFIPARLDEHWRSKDRFSCLVGNAQISYVWSTLYRAIGDIRFLNGALKLNQDLKSVQVLVTPDDCIRGGIKGSHPGYGLYITFGFPSWGAKFFIDALLAEDRAMDKLRSV